MHRTNRVPCALLGALLWLGLLFGGGTANAQPDKAEKGPMPTPAAKTIPLTIQTNTTRPLQMKGKQMIASAVNERENILRVTPVEGDPFTVNITGLTPGTSQLTLKSVPDPKTKEVTTEIYDILVELDIGLLRNLLSRAVPTAAVTPIPGAGNSIIMTGTVTHAEDIETILGIARSVAGAGTGPAQIINAMRVGGVVQVQLDVVVARVARSEIRNMAFDLLDTGSNHILSSTTGGNLAIPTALSGPLVGPPNITTSPSPVNAFLAIFDSKQNVFALLEALRENDLAKLLAEPHLVTLSGRPATFLSGGDQAVPQVSGFGGTAGITFEPFGTRLQFLPIVLGNGRIYLEVEPEVSRLDAANGVTLPGGGGLVPGRSTQRVRTSVIIEDGQTFAIGGLIQHDVEGSTVKLPILGDLPFVGVFFSRKQYTKNEEELVVLVTPHVVDPMDCSQVPKFLPGMETRDPDDFELFLEGILEAPRGQREVNHGTKYTPAWQNGPTAQCYPCLGCGPGNPDVCPASGCHNGYFGGSDGIHGGPVGGPAGCPTCGSGLLSGPVGGFADHAPVVPAGAMGTTGTVVPAGGVPVPAGTVQPARMTTEVPH